MSPLLEEMGDGTEMANPRLWTPTSSGRRCRGFRALDNCTVGYLQLSSKKNEVPKDNGYLVSLGYRVVELARFVLVLSLFINVVLSSTPKLP